MIFRFQMFSQTFIRQSDIVKKNGGRVIFRQRAPFNAVSVVSQGEQEFVIEVLSAYDCLKDIPVFFSSSPEDFVFGFEGTGWNCLLARETEIEFVDPLQGFWVRGRPVIDPAVEGGE